MKLEIYAYQNYKRYIREALSSPGSTGNRAKLAEHLACGNSFVSQVLNGHVHFSLEQGMKVNSFFSHRPDESHYFMLLLQYGRAGSNDLKGYFLTQVNGLREKRKVIQERIQVKQTLTLEDQVIYYSSWIYAAIHILLSIPKFQNKTEIARAMKLPMVTVSEVLEFLCDRNLAERNGDRFSIGKNRIHLGKDSPMISRHHGNWRTLALQSLDRREKDGTHFSVVMGVSLEDAEKIRSILLNAMEQTEDVIQKTREECLYSLCIDLFSLA